jgi:hypothetical protein
MLLSFLIALTPLGNRNAALFGAQNQLQGSHKLCFPNKYWPNFLAIMWERPISSSGVTRTSLEDLYWISEFKIDGFVLVATWSWREAAMNRASSQGHAKVGAVY